MLLSNPQDKGGDEKEPVSVVIFLRVFLLAVRSVLVNAKQLFLSETARKYKIGNQQIVDVVTVLLIPVHVGN